MELEQAGKWLITLLVFSVQLTVAYAIGRAIWLGGGFVLNPFQPGWGRLAARYHTDRYPARMASASARVGIVTYKNVLSLAYGPQELYLGKSFFGQSYLRIPYADIRVVQAPRRHTILLLPFRTDGLFEVAGVSLNFSADTAEALIARLNQTSQLPASAPSPAAPPTHPAPPDYDKLLD